MTQTVDGVWGGFCTSFEAETPRVDQRCNGDVEGTIGFFRYLFGQLKYFEKHFVGRNRLVSVDSRYNRMLVKRRQRGVYLVQFCQNFFLQIVATLIGNVVGGAEDGAPVVLIGRILLLTNNVNGACNEKA